MAYQMAATAVTFNDLEGCRLQVAGCRTSQMQSIKHLCSILHDFDW